MKPAIFIFLATAGFWGSHTALAQSSPSSGNWLPDSGVKSPYSPLAIPTTLKPVETSLSDLLKQGYKITSTSNYANNAGALFTLTHKKQTLLCLLTAPNPQTDQNVPTSRCWELN